jgi:GNAT superfamily N-acetyltransferase
VTSGTPAEIPAAVRALAEDGNAVAPLGPGQERIVRPRFALRIGTHPEPPFNVVCRVRLTAQEVAGAIAEVRSLLGARGHRGQWEVGSSSTPADLADRLTAHGIPLDPDEPIAGAMVLMTPPKVTRRPEVVVRTVRTAADAAAAQEIRWRCFMGDAPWTEERRAAAVAEAAAASPDTGNATYLAFIDGEPVAAADASFCEAGVIMAGGATLPEARGRGAHGALVAARWDAAVARGTPALVTHAGSMSRPILERLGFVLAAEVRFFNDTAPL